MAKLAGSEPNGILIKDAAVRPEFATVRTVAVLFGLSRTTLFRLMSEGRISWIHYKQPGARKGVRLIAVQSVRDHIQTFASGK